MAEKIEFEEIWAALCMPFDPDAVRHLNLGGKSIAYVSKRTVQNRLDEVLGPQNWWAEYADMRNGIKCKLTLRLPNGGETVTKEGVSRNPEIPIAYSKYADARIEAMEDTKNDGVFTREREEKRTFDKRADAIQQDDESTVAEAFKRAAVEFGVGRYLYPDGVPDFARHLFKDNDEHFAYPEPEKDKSAPRESAPRQGTRSAAPARSAAPSRSAAPARGRAASNGDEKNFGPPKTGRALFAWAKSDKAPKDAVDLINTIGREEGWPDRMVDWDEEKVGIAYTEVSGDGGETP